MSIHPFSRENIARWFFLLLAFAVGFLFFHIIAPFFITLLTAAMIAVLVTPLERWLRARLHHAWISTIIVLLGVFILLVGPLTLAGIVMVRQGVEMTQWLLANPTAFVQFTSGTHPLFSLLPESLRSLLALVDISSIVQALSDWIKTHGADVFSSGAGLVLKTFIFFVCLYFFLFDRERFLQEMMALSPLKDSVDKSIASRMVETVRGVVFGSLIVACIQGVVAGIGLTLFGVPGALIWAACVIISAQIPMLGTSIIMIPAVLYLFLTGHTGAGIGLLIWALLAVGLIDNMLQPLIVGGRTRMHALLILLSMLGGLEYFGPIGFVLGPTVLAAFLVILEMYKGGFLER
jgi:predicted PurR-regulated permease PerM